MPHQHQHQQAATANGNIIIIIVVSILLQPDPRSPATILSVVGNHHQVLCIALLCSYLRQQKLGIPSTLLQRGRIRAEVFLRPVTSLCLLHLSQTKTSHIPVVPSRLLLSLFVRYLPTRSPRTTVRRPPSVNSLARTSYNYLGTFFLDNTAPLKSFAVCRTALCTTCIIPRNGGEFIHKSESNKRQPTSSTFLALPWPYGATLTSASLPQPTPSSLPLAPSHPAREARKKAAHGPRVRPTPSTPHPRSVAASALRCVHLALLTLLLAHHGSPIPYSQPTSPIQSSPAQCTFYFLTPHSFPHVLVWSI